MSRPHRTSAPLDTMQWRSIAGVRSRYQRSVHLERDAETRTALEGYVITPLVRTLSERLASGVARQGKNRSWSIIGPYGTGKSAFAVFASSLLGPATDPATLDARRLLARTDAELASRLFGSRGLLSTHRGLWPVLATGERKPAEVVLLEALQRSAERFWSGRGLKPHVLKALATAVERARSGKRVSAREVVSLFEDVTAKVCQSAQRGQGLLVVLDEAGKLLEHAARSPEHGDMQLLQELAESANRSPDDHPLMFLVLLHQSIEHYAGRLGTTQKNEWAKVRGRFEDAIFQDAPDQLLRLIGAALERGPVPSQLQLPLRAVIEKVADAASLPGLGNTSALVDLLSSTAPLHPVTALLLGPLFRSRIAQNERSLFAFLASMEPYGFQEFLRTPISTNGAPSLYRADRLYDYVIHNLGEQIYAYRGQHWAQTETALRRLPQDAEALEAQLLKVIGLFGAIGDGIGLCASTKVLSLALGDASEDAHAVVRAALERLVAGQLIIYRKYKDSFQLWEGSDLDLEALVAGARGELDPDSSILPRLARAVPPRPLVARRHLFSTGTLRYFAVHYVDDGVLDSGLREQRSDADGHIWLMIPRSENSAGEARKRLERGGATVAVDAQGKPIIVAVPEHAERIRSLALELAALESVQASTPALHGDAVARRELSGRLLDAESLLRHELNRLLIGAGGCAWYHRGERHAVPDARSLATFLSDVCDNAYAKAPFVHNELLNRRALSSSAAAARRSLMQAMLEHGSSERLGIEGAPPELSMYRSLLEEHGLHRGEAGAWSFGPPSRKRRGSLRSAYEAILQALTQAEDRQVSVDSIYQRLRLPPYGMKDGPLPIVLLCVLLALDSEVALYEDSAFVPSLNIAVIERLLRCPDKFQLQRYRLGGPRDAFLARLVPGTGPTPRHEQLLPIVRQLIRLVRGLPEYSRNTRALSQAAQGVRDALLRAREPGPLVFEDLPRACGFSPVPAGGDPKPAEIDVIWLAIRSALRELQSAYPALLSLIEQNLAHAFALPIESGALRDELQSRANPLLAHAADTQLKGFLLRAADTSPARDPWLVSLGTHLAGKPPEAWNDHDVDQMRTQLWATARRFARLEAVAFDGSASHREGVRVLRLAITEPGAPEHERVLSLRIADQEALETFCSRLREAVLASASELPRDSAVAGLALVARDLIEGMNGDPRSAGGKTLA